MRKIMGKLKLFFATLAESFMKSDPSQGDAVIPRPGVLDFK